MGIVRSSVSGSFHQVMDVGSGVVAHPWHSAHCSKYIFQAGPMKFPASCCKLVPDCKNRTFCRVIPFSTGLASTIYIGAKRQLPKAQLNEHISTNVAVVPSYEGGFGIHRKPRNRIQGYQWFEETETVRRSKLNQKLCRMSDVISHNGTMMEEHLGVLVDKRCTREVLTESRMFCSKSEKKIETEEQCTSKLSEFNMVIALAKGVQKVPLENKAIKKDASSRGMIC